MGNCETACGKCKDILNGENEFNDNDPQRLTSTKPKMVSNANFNNYKTNAKYNDYKTSVVKI
jgi:hypothetical protein